ncbi:Nem1-Spo7 phosphatase regulatory subunit [Maublancomyces gigas]|uniref:Nem1-Spo7 phosphatase regulatory subunit n=1 Tax=Discina gigas TaxID=1032678 RepID=A0ABR3GGV8_9PEZI
MTISPSSPSSSGTRTPEQGLVRSPPPSIRSPTSSPITSITSRPPPAPPGNPLETAPSAPSQVYLNLLILEASLRSQYLHHLSRRRKFTFFLLLLFCWIAFFIHRIYGLGGSPYYYVSHLEWLGLLGGSVTATLYYATGLYQKTVVEPRRFVYTANRGLRGFNVKLVKAPLPTREWVTWWWNWYTFHPPPTLRNTPSASTRRPSTLGPKPRRPSASIRRPIPPVVEHRHTPPPSSAAMGRPSLLTPHVEEATEDDPDDEVEEYLPGGLHLKLVILPKRFSADFREGWELYRTEYWDRENEARVIRRRDASNWRPWSRKPKPKPKVGDSPDPPSAPPSSMASPAGRVRRGSIASERRSPSVSSRAGTPEPEAVAGVGVGAGTGTGTPTGKRRGSLVKRRPKDLSDSGTERRSESPVTDRSSEGAAGTTAKRKPWGKTKGNGRKSVVTGNENG